MKIGIEAQRIFREKKHGMDIYALQLIRHLQAIDKVNEYYIFVRPGDDVCLQETSNFRIVLVNSISYADWEQIMLPISVKRYKLDILHCTSNTAPWFSQVPTVLTLHDIIYLNSKFAGGSMYQRLGHLYRKLVVPRAFRKASKVSTVSQFEANVIHEHFGNNDKLAVIYNGINPLFYDKAYCENKALEITKSLKLPKEYILFLGNTAPKKNMSRMLHAYAAYITTSEDPLPLVIVESSSSVVDSYLQKDGLMYIKKHLICVGYVSNDWLPIIYRHASLFIYPSLRESFGIPVLEAMASKTAVITSNSSSMPEIG
ncbi:MAG: glycosyltransferase involved in cell wall biosynthesis, partial [Cyclobacteriaceae bacterium]